MRLLKISQSIVFIQDSFSGVFKKGQEVTFSGYINGSGEIMTGYMKQEPIHHGNSLTLYVKGYRVIIGSSEEWVLIQTTKSNCNAPITMCSWFSCVYNGKASGYLDDTDGRLSKEERYFFTNGNYIAHAEIQIEEIPKESLNVYTRNYDPNEEYTQIAKKRNRMLNKLYCAKKQNLLNCGFLFDYIKSNWTDTDWRLIHIYPLNTKY